MEDLIAKESCQYLNLTKILSLDNYPYKKIVALCNVHRIIALSHETIVQPIGRGSVKSIVWSYIHCETWQLKSSKIVY